MGSARSAVVLLSGGLDSATAAAIARAEGYAVHAMSVAYGQRHGAEIEAARRVAAALDVERHEVIEVNLGTIGGSALTDPGVAVPEAPGQGIPVTYVPARNTLFLALALGWAEVLGARDIFIGVNAVDYSGYPDCRPEFIAQFEKLSTVATKVGVETGQGFRIHAPLMRWSKADIVRKGAALGLDYSLTVSCYQADREGRACGRCESCRFRRRGFIEAGLADSTRYQAGATPS